MLGLVQLEAVWVGGWGGADVRRSYRVAELTAVSVAWSAMWSAYGRFVHSTETVSSYQFLCVCFGPHPPSA